MEMIELQLVNTGGSWNIKNNGLFTCLHLYRLNDCSLSPAYTWGLVEIVLVGSNRGGETSSPERAACLARSRAVRGSAAWIAFSSFRQPLHRAACCIAEWEDSCAKMDRHSQFFNLVLRILLSCKDNSVDEAPIIHFVLFILILPLR